MRNYIIILSILFAAACSAPTENATNDISGEAVLKHVDILSSDDFMGRMPFTEGEAKTVNYIRDQYQAIGLEPGNGDSFFQEVPMVELEAVDFGPMQIKGESGTNDLNFKTDYVALSRRVTEKIEVTDSELVFAGFGVIAPEYNWNDYEGLDVAGKTVVVLVNDPGFNSGDENLFKGDAMTYYGRWTYKYEEAARQGATGILIIHETEPAAYPWGVVENSWTGANLYLNAEDNNMSRCSFEGWVTIDVAKGLFEQAGYGDLDFTTEARKADFKPFSLKQTVSLSFTNLIEHSRSKNVAGLLKGSENPDEVIIYSGHWDHLGVGFAIDGDSIYNGAVDNASGIAAIIEIARKFTSTEPKPKRSILFLAVTAEEQGLLGSAYYAEHPLFEPKKSVANINIDALTYLGKMKDLTVVGFGQSELDDIAAEFAAAQDRYILPDQHAGKGYFFRSDHFNFAKIGIPALYASGSHEHMTRGVEWTEEQNAYFTANNYHQPSDEINMEWSAEGIVQDSELLYEIGNKLAQDPALWPKWKEGSEFKAAREN